MTGKLTPKPDDTHRTYLTRRAKEHVALVNKVLPKRLQKTPSQKRSENSKKRELRRAQQYERSCRQSADNILFDCYTCPKYPCGVDPVACDKIMPLDRCVLCGLPVRHYNDKTQKWVYCKDCREHLKLQVSVGPEVVK